MSYDVRENFAFFCPFFEAGTGHERGLDTSGDGTRAGTGHERAIIIPLTGSDWTLAWTGHWLGLDTGSDWTLEF